MSKEIQVNIEHPMEEVLEIEPGTTVMTRVEHERKELSVVDSFDEKDIEIEEQFQEVYEAAMDAFEQQSQEAEVIEPKYKARNQEVAVQFLNAALTAARDKSTLKQHKDKLVADRVKAAGPKTLNQNLIVGDRNEILKHLMREESDAEPAPAD